MKRIYSGVVVTWWEGVKKHRKYFDDPEQADRFFGRLAWRQAEGGKVSKLKMKPTFDEDES